MDSCQIFNFLFGPRRRTSSQRKRRSSSKARQEATKQDEAAEAADRPSSLHDKLQVGGISAESSFEPQDGRQADEERRNGEEEEPTRLAANEKCETYRAEFVDAIQVLDELEAANGDKDLQDDKLAGRANGWPGKGAQVAAAASTNDKLSSCATGTGRQAAPRRVVLYERCDTVAAPPAQQCREPLVGVQTSGAARENLVDENNNSNFEDSPQHSTRRRKSDLVRSLVESFELAAGRADAQPTPPETPQRQTRAAPQPRRADSCGGHFRSGKPTTIVKPLPPKTPPKSNKAKLLNALLCLPPAPTKVGQLFLNEDFLAKFFAHLDPIERCQAAQVCRLWRQVLYSNPAYWTQLVGVIDCTQLRREHLSECIVNALELAKQRQQKCHFDDEEIWRIQELCNRFASKGCGGAPATAAAAAAAVVAAQPSPPRQSQSGGQLSASGAPEQLVAASRKSSSSIASQAFSSTSTSLSTTTSSTSFDESLLSPVSESSRVDSLKERLFASLDKRKLDAICLAGASDEDIEELARKTSAETHLRVLSGKLKNCCLSDRGLELFCATFNKLEELELSGCNELSNSLELEPLSNLRRLIVTDCINITDGLAQKLSTTTRNKLCELTLQAYHLTDAFLDHLSLNSSYPAQLVRLELPNCKELTNSCLFTIAKHFTKLEALSISGSTKITDEGIELLAEEARNLRQLDLSWCLKITDASLECLATSELTRATLEELILDRNQRISDCGLSCLGALKRLQVLYLRWCNELTDVGVESLLARSKTIRCLSLAGLVQVTVRSLLCLTELDKSLEELELTNCPAAASCELIRFLATRLPKCNIIT